MPAQTTQLIYESGGWEIDIARRELRARGKPVAIGGRAFEIVEALVQSAGELVTRDELMDRVWRGAIVGDNTLQVHISAVRKALGTDRGLLKTASGRGYRLLGSWSVRETRATPASVREERDPIPAQPLEGNLPAIAQELVGRREALQHVRDLLSAYRAVTLTGPGGIGKTALALEVGRSASGIGGERWLVELAALSDPGLVPSAVAGVLGLRIAGSNIAAEPVARAIGERKVLMVLDNCEHVVDAAAELAETVLRLCPNTTVLATSREVLRIEAERVYRVLPLEVPPPDRDAPSDLLSHSAVQMFLARATAMGASLSTNTANLLAIGAICRRLDGIPLAIEFAAARAATLGLPEVAALLDDRFRLLSGGRRTALPRHQTLRAALDWSYALLSQSEAAVLRWLAVFVGDFSLEAAIAVAGDVPPPGVIDDITSLAAKSLIVAEPRDGIAQYRLLETIRAYALEKARHAGDLNGAARRHAQFYLGLFLPAEADSERLSQAEWTSTYGHHLDNVRAALDWAFSAGGDAEVGANLTVAAVPLWLHSSLFAECLDRVRRATSSLGADSAASDRRRMQLSAAIATSLFFTNGAVDDVKLAWTATFDLAARFDETDYQLRALWGLWSYSIAVGDYEAADKLGRRFHQTALHSNNTGDLLIGERMIGGALHFLGNQTAARHHIEAMLSQYDESIHRPNVVRFQYDQCLAARVTLARILWVQGFPEQATRAARAAVDAAAASHHPLSLCFALNEAATPVALFSGDWVSAERYLETLHAQSVQHDFAVFHARAIGSMGVLAAKRGDPSSGAQLIRAALQKLDRTGSHAYPMLLGSLAEALGALGDIDEALLSVETALSRCERTGERWYIADLLRIKGELTLKSSDPAAPQSAAASFLSALERARFQGALSWELRAATSFARLLRHQGRPWHAIACLQPVFDRFTEGFDTADLITAKELRDTLRLGRVD